MAFKLRSGNKVSFKNMGSSPAKNMKTGSYEHSFESPAKQEGPIPKENIKLQPGERKDTYVYKGKDRRERIIDYDERAGVLEQNELQDSDEYLGGGDAKKGAEKRKQIKKTIKKLDHEAAIIRNRKTNTKSPAKQRVVRGGEGQDQNKIFNNKGEHVGDWVNGKKVMRKGISVNDFDDTVAKPKKSTKPTPNQLSDAQKDKKPKSPAKQMPVKTKGLGPRKAFGGVKNPELTKKKKTKERVINHEQVHKVMKDGSKNRAHYKGKIIEGWVNPYAVKPTRP